MRDAINAVGEAFARLSTGGARVPMRTSVEVEAGGVALLMPAAADGALSVKIVSIHPHNPARELPLIHALVALVDAATGRPLALMEGGSLTALRTGAASGLATDLLARADARIAAIFGAGRQARTQLEAVATVRRLEKALVWAPTRGHVEDFIADMQPRLPDTVLKAAASPRETVADADIVCCATTSATPVFDGADLGPGVHINAIGSFTPHMREIDAVTLARASRLVVDSRQAALAEAGDLLAAIAQGAIGEHSISAEIGEIVAGLKPRRQAAEEITCFKSVGNAVQDLAVARLAWRRAVEENAGLEVLWS